METSNLISIVIKKQNSFSLAQKQLCIKWLPIFQHGLSLNTQGYFMVTQVHEPNKLVLAVNHNHMGYKLDAWAHSAIKLHIYGKIHCLGRKIGKCSIKCQNITISNLVNYIYI